MLLNRIANGAGATDSNDPEVSSVYFFSIIYFLQIERIKDDIASELAYLEELITLYPQETLTKKQYEILSKIIREINSNIINAENIAAESVLEMAVIKNEYDNFMNNEEAVQDFVVDTLEIKR